MYTCGLSPSIQCQSVSIWDPLDRNLSGKQNLLQTWITGFNYEFEFDYQYDFTVRPNSYFRNRRSEFAKALSGQTLWPSSCLIYHGCWRSRVVNIESWKADKLYSQSFLVTTNQSVYVTERSADPRPNVWVDSSREHPHRANPGHLKKLFKCSALRAIFVGKCPDPRFFCGGQMLRPPVHPINITKLLVAIF